jgi:hypothetical protein
MKCVVYYVLWFTTCKKYRFHSWRIANFVQKWTSPTNIYNYVVRASPYKDAFFILSSLLVFCTAVFFERDHGSGFVRFVQKWTSPTNIYNHVVRASPYKDTFILSSRLNFCTVVFCERDHGSGFVRFVQKWTSPTNTYNHAVRAVHDVRAVRASPYKDAFILSSRFMFCTVLFFERDQGSGFVRSATSIHLSTSNLAKQEGVDESSSNGGAPKDFSRGHIELSNSDRWAVNAIERTRQFVVINLRLLFPRGDKCFVSSGISRD